MSPVRMSKFEAAIRAAVAFHQARSQHDLAGMMALVSQDCVLENPGPAPVGSVVEGKEAIQHHWQGFFEEFPQVHYEVEEAFSTNERCILRWKAAGGEQPLRGVDIYRMKDGLICEILTYVKG